MSALTDRLDEMASHASAAIRENGDICVGKKRWTMTVPPDNTRDSDLIFDALVTDNERAIEALRAVLALHVPGDGSSQGWTTHDDYGSIEPYCAGCEANDEYAVEWPCATVRAIATALQVQP